MKVDIGHSKVADVAELQALWVEAFPEDLNSPFVEWFFANRYTEDSSYILKIDGELAAMAFFTKVQMNIGGESVEVPYIVGVATAAKFRMQGASKGLLQFMFKDLAKRGYEFCVLKPFKASFYQKMGFEFFCNMLEMNYDFSTLPVKKLAGNVDFVQHFEHQAAVLDMMPIYEKWVLDWDIYVERNLDQQTAIMKDHFEDGGQLKVILVDGKAAAYVMYKSSVNGVYIRELAYENFAAGGELLECLVQEHRWDNPKAVICLPDVVNSRKMLPKTLDGYSIRPFAMVKPLTKGDLWCYNLDEEVLREQNIHFHEFF